MVFFNQILSFAFVTARKLTTFEK